MNPADQRHTFTKHEVPHQCVAEGVTGKKCTVSGDTHAAHLTVSWSFLSSGGVTQFRPLVHPHPSSVTQCNLWCWEITEAGRPGRHSQLGRTPPVRWGHSQPQTEMWAFHSFSKASHPCIRRCFSAQRPFTSTRIGEQVYTWGRWTEHPGRCVLRTICSTWLGKHLAA